MDLSYAGTRDTLLRRALVLFARPSGTHIGQAVRLAAPFGDAFADLYPEFVAALSEGFGQRFPSAVRSTTWLGWIPLGLTKSSS